jgi:hypothetical protein
MRLVIIAYAELVKPDCPYTVEISQLTQNYLILSYLHRIRSHAGQYIVENAHGVSTNWIYMMQKRNLTYPRC